MSQTNGSRHENAEPMVEDDKDKDVDAPVNVPIRRRPGRPRKNFKAQAKVCPIYQQNQILLT
jgi:hypothetical protein